MNLRVGAPSGKYILRSDNSQRASQTRQIIHSAPKGRVVMNSSEGVPIFNDGGLSEHIDKAAYDKALKDYTGKYHKYMNARNALAQQVSTEGTIYVGTALDEWINGQLGPQPVPPNINDFLLKVGPDSDFQFPPQ